MALIKCENVSIGYEGQMVVHDLNFEINQGDYLKMYPLDTKDRWSYMT